MQTFSHGGDINSFAIEIGCKVDEVIDLSSNINFIKPEIKIDFNTIDISSYPSYDSLYSTLANHYGIDTNQLELYNGGSSAIFSFIRDIKLQNCTIYSPAYLEYKKAALLHNKQIELVNRFIELDKKIIPNSIVIFVNPSTPDGSFYDIEKLLKYWKKQNCIVLIDESFIEFTHFESATKYLKDYNNLYILKSLTKFYGCAGVRAGVIISNKQNISKLKQFEPLWKISQYDSYFIQEVLKDKNFTNITKTITINAREYLENILQNSLSFKYYLPSNGNYILAYLKTLTSTQLQKNLKNYKIMVRDCSNFDFLDEKYVRIAVKSIKNLKLFEKALKKIEEIV